MQVDKQLTFTSNRANAFIGSAPSNLTDFVHLYTPRALRVSSDTRLLRIQRYKRNTHGFRFFFLILVLTSGIFSLMISGIAQLFHHSK